MIKFSKVEIRDIIIALLALTILYALSVTRSMGWSAKTLTLFIPISFVAVGLGFILHELGHKFVAQHFGFYSEFRRWDYGLILGLITLFTNFMIFAPGAVYFGSYGRMVTEEENGKISLAGPVVNIILAVLFLGLALAIRPMVTASNVNVMYIIFLTLYLGFRVNSFLALFNMIPIPPLDGSKVISWSLPIFITTILAAGFLSYLSYIIVLI